MARGRRSTRTREMVHEHNLHAFHTPTISSHTAPTIGKQQFQTGQLANLGNPIDRIMLLPLGIVSIIYATKVDNLWNSGQQEEAIKASNMARLFFFLALGGGVLAVIIGFISGLASVLMGGGYY